MRLLKSSLEVGSDNCNNIIQCSSYGTVYLEELDFSGQEYRTIFVTNATIAETEESQETFYASLKS